MPRITVTLKASEKDALLLLAEHEMRDPRSQAAHIIRQALIQSGMIHPETTPIVSFGANSHEPIRNDEPSD